MWRLLPLLLLAACAETAGPCRLQPIADLPATTDGNRLMVAGQVDGAAVNLLIDTGAERTVLSTATVAALQLPRSQRSATRLTGIGGAVSNADVFAVLGIGHADFRDRLAVANIPDFDGIVGGDMLSRYDLELNVPDRRVRLWRAPGCHAADLPWAGPRATVPVHVTGDRLRVAVTIDGHKLDALLDSGAARSLLQADAAQRLGVTGAALAADPAGRARGLDGALLGVRTHRFTSLAIGGEQIANPQIGVAAFQLDAADMLLGIDYLRSHRVWVSYRSGELFIQTAGAAG
jgi:predicted aspartyl protease